MFNENLYLKTNEDEASLFSSMMQIRFELIAVTPRCWFGLLDRTYSPQSSWPLIPKSLEPGLGSLSNEHALGPLVFWPSRLSLPHGCDAGLSPFAHHLGTARPQLRRHFA